MKWPFQCYWGHFGSHTRSVLLQDYCKPGLSLESQIDSGPFTKHLHDDIAGCPPSKIPNPDKNYFNLAWLCIKKWTMTLQLNGLFFMLNLSRLWSWWMAGRDLATFWEQLLCVFFSLKMGSKDKWLVQVYRRLPDDTHSFAQKKKSFILQLWTKLLPQFSNLLSKTSLKLVSETNSPPQPNSSFVFPLQMATHTVTPPHTHTHTHTHYALYTRTVHHVHPFKPQKLRQANNCH